MTVTGEGLEKVKWERDDDGNAWMVLPPGTCIPPQHPPSYAGLGGVFVQLPPKPMSDCAANREGKCHLAVLGLALS